MDSNKHKANVNNSPAPKKRKVLDLKDRMNVVKRHEKGDSARKIAESFGVGKTQIQNILKEKTSIRDRFVQGENVDRKYSQVCFKILMNLYFC